MHEESTSLLFLTVNTTWLAASCFFLLPSLPWRTVFLKPTSQNKNFFPFGVLSGAKKIVNNTLCKTPHRRTAVPSPPPSWLVPDDLCEKILTRPLPGSLGVEDWEGIIAVKVGLQECHWDGSRQGSQTFSKSGTLPGDKEVHLEVIPSGCWSHTPVRSLTALDILGYSKAVCSISPPSLSRY